MSYFRRSGRGFSLLLLLLCSIVLLSASGGSPGPDPLQEARWLLLLSKYQEARVNLLEAAWLFRRQGRLMEEADSHLLLARLYLELADPSRAKESLDAASRCLKGSADPQREGLLVALYARCMLSERRSDETFDYLEERRGRILAFSPGEGRSEFLLVLGEATLARGMRRSAKRAYSDALDEAAVRKDPRGQILALLGILAVSIREEAWSEAEALLARTGPVAKAADSPYLFAEVHLGRADLYMSRGKFKEAILSCESAADIFTRTGNRRRYASTLLRLAAIERSRNDNSAALVIASKAQAVFQESGDPWGAMEALRFRLNVYFSTSRIDEARKAMEELIEAAQATGHPGDLAKVLLARGNWLQIFWPDPEEAAGSFRQAGDLFARAGNRRGQIEALVQLGRALASAGKTDEALRTCESALLMRLGLQSSPEEEDSWFALNASSGGIRRIMALLFIQKVDYDGAQKVLEEALTEERKAGDSRGLALDHLNQALLDLYRYQYDEAAEEFRRALSLARSIENRERRWEVYNTLSGYLIQGGAPQGLKTFRVAWDPQEQGPFSAFIRDLFKDEALVREMLSAYESLIRDSKEKQDLWGEAASNFLSALFFLAGERLPEARDRLERAVDLFREVHSAHLEATCHYLLGYVLGRGGACDKALAALRESIAMYDRTGMVRQRSSAFWHMALIQKTMGRRREAIDSFEKALVDLRQTRNPFREASLLLMLADTRASEGQHRQALGEYDRAFDLARQNNDPRTEGAALVFRALSQEALGDLEGAGDSLACAIGIYKDRGMTLELRDAYFHLGRIQEKKGNIDKALDAYRESYRSIERLAGRLPPSAEYSRFPSQISNRQILEQMVRLLVDGGKYQEAMEIIEFARSLELVNALSLDRVRTSDPAFNRLLSGIANLRRKMQGIEEEMAGRVAKESRSAYLSNLLASTKQQFFAAINRIRAENPDYERLVSARSLNIARVQEKIPEDAVLLEYFPAPDCIYIFLVTRGNFRIHRVQAGREDLYGHIRDFRREAASPQPSESILRERLLALRKILISPIEEEIRTFGRLLVVPGGLLYYLPFGAMAREGPGGKPVYLIEEKQVQYLTSADLLVLREGKSPAPSRKGIAAFAWPAGRDLPGTIREVEEIRRIFPGARIYTGQGATLSQVMKESGNVGILHFATHTVLNSSDVNESFIRLGGAGKEGEERLSLGEIYGLPLEGTGLVVLSGCSTAIGEQEPGREIASLATAFSTAGARAVIASLWPVEDEATSRLFGAFYGALGKGKTWGEALREAQMDLLRQRGTASPIFWSPFILMGM